MTTPAGEHVATTFRTWKKVQALKSTPSLVLDGEHLDMAAVVAVARHGLAPRITDDPRIHRQLQASIDTLNEHLEKRRVIYGVNTGFGGSADSRTQQLRKLQVALLQHTQSAIITSADSDDQKRIDRDGQSHVIPTDWVKAAIVTRANQNLRGHSAVRAEVIDALLELLRHDLTPLVPLRGTISASGDLMPLSYIAGAITGTPGVMVRLPSGRVAPAKEALPAHALPLIELAPKEGLGLINGTAPSAAAAALVVYEAQRMAVLAQLMTAFTAECLTGNVEWSAPFIHAIRPHPGQIEAAKNIRIFLTGSKLARGFDAGAGSKSRTDTAGLCQDRYSCRTAPQWMGPYLEDLLLAQRQIEIELNSTSDNPVVEASPLAASAGEGEVYSGGNFQAVSLTSALDKARLATQMIGRMLFSQCTELINPNLSNGLDPNLVHGDPDDSYTCKGIDVNMAAYMAELAALAHPPSAHVQSAEMHNQGINSLAFLTARRTMEALDVLAHMTAAQIFVCCQAADLRDYHRRFLAAVPLAAAVDALNVSREIKTLLKAQLPGVLQECWYEANKIGHVDRCRIVASRLASHILDVLAEKNVTSLTVDAVRRFQNAIQQRMESWVKDPANDPDRSFNNRSAARVGLGQGASTLYNLARGELGVRFHLGLKDQDRQTTIGSDVSKIYEAIRDETVMDRVMSAFTREFDAVNGNADGSLFAKL